MPSATQINSFYPAYPRHVAADNYRVTSKLPAVSLRKMDRRLCAGRVWIFLLLGVLLLVLGLVSVGVYFNIDGITTSSRHTEILPLYINASAILLAGVTICLLFWKRLKVLVVLSVVISIATGFLSGITAVLTGTHILQPILSLLRCRFYASQQLCRCFSPYYRDVLSLQYSDTEETTYDFEGVTSCTVIEDVLTQLLYTQVGVFSVVFLVCILSAILALLVLRTERIKRGFFQDETYEEVYTVSGSSSIDQSDSEAEVIPEVVSAPLGNSLLSNQTSKNSSLNRNFNYSHQSEAANSINSSRIVTSAASSKTNTLQGQSLSLQKQKTPIVQRSNTPIINDLGKENLANRYRINKTPDSELTNSNPKVRQRISKTPDREIGSRRRNSFTLSKRLSKSCDSLDSSGSDGKKEESVSNVNDGKRKGKLKEHRRRGKRAATVHTLDTDQLLLILNLQMRYLNETKEQQKSQKDLTNNQNTNAKTRRAITPQPSSQRPTIPPQVRSHTPQPYRANRRHQDRQEREFYDQIEALNRNYRNSEAGANKVGVNNNVYIPRRNSRLSSDSSAKSSDFNFGNFRSGGKYPENNFISNQNGGSNYRNGQTPLNQVNEKYLVSQQMFNYNIEPNIPVGHNPYIQAKQYRENSSAENIHYVTYSDNMLSCNPHSKPKTRASVQNNILPPEPLHRGSTNQLPPQPVSRQRVVEQRLPPQPVHRGNSAFHVVDRGSKSRSPSITSDRNMDQLDSTSRRKTKNDYGEVAIRENFRMNPSPFMLSDYQTGNETRSNQNPNKQKLAGKLNQQTEYLPPYSGPPSYKEYVSSCDNSVTSSLSSNPEDVYSTPRRRVPRDQQELTNQRAVEGKIANQQSGIHMNDVNRRDVNYEAIQDQNVDTIYGNFENYPNQNLHRNSEGQRSRVQSDEAIYGVMGKSKVKQFIVPEDYYSSVCKVKRRDPLYANENLNQPSAKMSSVTKTNQPSLQNSNPTQNAPLTHSNVQHLDSQIAPDAKYHEYEDVYDTPDNVSSNREAVNPHSVLSHGLQGSQPSTKSLKSKQRSPKKHQKAPYPVSKISVSAHAPSFVNSSAINNVHSQVTNSVENVHAENVNNIPRIKLNDAETECVTDDDVFADNNDNLGYYGDMSKIENVNNSGMKELPQVSEPNKIIFDGNLHNFLPSNENSNPGHVITNEETEEGYMKMSLPSKTSSVHNTLPTANDIMGNNHMTILTANENVGSNQLTNENERHRPEGIENDTEETKSEYEETGV